MVDDLCLPYAFYGSLRPGCGNDWLWSGRGVCSPGGVVRGFRLVTERGLGFPFALPAAGEFVMVDVVRPLGGFEGVLRRDLDRLEGYPDFYGRGVVQVELGGGVVSCCMYWPVDAVRYEGLLSVPGGDWRLFCGVGL
jgi:gamma-glutamylcyclotransferase (GGCT)/AIG2-like uncharacterized protein YtfP